MESSRFRLDVHRRKHKQWETLIEAEAVAAAAVHDETLEDHEKCMTRLVPSAGKPVKCHSSQLQESRFIAATVILNDDDSDHRIETTEF